MNKNTGEPDMRLMLVKYSCGCVGFAPITKDTCRAIIVDYCATDYQDDDIALTSCDMKDHNNNPKKYEYLTHDEQERYYGILRDLIQDGNRFREMMSILGR